MKQRDLTKRIAQAAASNNCTWELVRQGAEHEIWACNGQRVSIPRHREINELTAQSIMKSLNDQLGEGWWR
jgi:hypothetical protein